MAACGTSDKPSNLLPEDKMVDILEDIHLTESKVNNLAMGSSDSSLAIFKKLASDILKKHQVDTAAFRKSYQYYVAQPEEFKAIYNKIIEHLEVKKKAASKSDALKAKAKKDSSKTKIVKETAPVTTTTHP